MGASESRFIEYALAARRSAAETGSPVLRRHLLSVAAQFEFEAFLVQRSCTAIAKTH